VLKATASAPVGYNRADEFRSPGSRAAAVAAVRHPLVEFDARAKGDSGRGDHSATGSAALNLQAQPKVSS